MAERCEDLEGLDETREETQEHSRRYRQRMIEAYGKMTREGVCRRTTRVKGNGPRYARYGRTI